MIAVTVHDDPAALGRTLAAEILAGLDRAAGRPYLLGCPGGRSPKPVYDALGVAAAAEGADLSRLVIVMMDEYLVDGPAGLVPCDPAAHFSCRGFAERELRSVLNAALPPERQLPAASVWFPDLADPPAYDRRIEAAGGVDLFLLASGTSDGHVAFAPPGSPADGATTIVPLAEATRRDNMGTFPGFRSLDEVPRFGLSIGLGSIARLSRAAAMIIHGAHKREAARRLVESRDFEPAWPATILHRCRTPRLHLDRAASGGA